MSRTEERLTQLVAELPLALERAVSQAAAEVQLTHQAVPLQGARYVAVGATGAASLAWAGAGRLLGWSLRATGGPVTVVLRDSRALSGEALAYVELDQDASETIWLGPSGVSFIEGVFVQAVAPGDGVIQGALYLGAAD